MSFIEHDFSNKVIEIKDNDEEARAEKREEREKEEETGRRGKTYGDRVHKREGGGACRNVSTYRKRELNGDAKDSDAQPWKGRTDGRGTKD